MHKSFMRGPNNMYQRRNNQNFDDDCYDDNFADGNEFHPPMGPGNFKRPRYADAYGDYRGGYGPGGGFGPRPMMPGPPPRMPPPLIHPMGMGPPRPPMWGRGPGFGGPPRKVIQDKAIQYLKRCGVTKENLKNLPHDLLILIQPDHCGLCDFSFDSYTTSRMHYISKNHLKNQKKWLSKTQGHKGPNESPFKSRDLYCELCDIQITSKSHGDAHYEGKPHRSIVEGRKKPKNPLLLQSNMQTRFEQLVRREKRCLKPVGDAAAVSAEDEAAKETKNMSSELYCEICKTMVTCSEQLTMHLNGKRHLSKEKQHILKMMSGKPAGENIVAEKGDEDEENVEGEKEVEGGAEVEGGENKEADDDWGNEAWENQEQEKGTAA